MVWQVFVKLHGERGAGMSAPNPIGSASVIAWQQLHGVRLTPWELSAIEQLDAAFMQHAAEQANKATPRHKR